MKREEPKPVENTTTTPVTRNVEQERRQRESGPCGLPKNCTML